MIWLETILGTSVIHALSITMLHSLWQGSVLAFLLALALRQIPEEKSHKRYELSAFTLFLVLTTSLVTFIVSLENTSKGGNIPMLEEIIIARDSLDLFPIMHYSVGIWFLGVLFLGAKLLLGFTHLAKMRYETHIETSFDKRILQKLQSRIRLNKSVRIFESALVSIPATIGYFKPIILMPIGMAMHLTPYQLEAIIAHELAHIKRSDFILNLFYSIVEILFYYHPAVWWISAQIRHEREANCDDIAIRITGSKENYLQTLLSIHPAEKSLPLAMGALGHPRSLLKRFQRQISIKKDNYYTMEKITALTLVLLAIIGLSFTANSQTKADKSLSKSQEIEIIETGKVSKNKDKQKSKIKSKVNGQRYEMEKEDDEITLLKINGKKVDPEDYSKHTNLINYLQGGQDISFQDVNIDLEEHEEIIEKHFEIEMDLHEEIDEEIDLEMKEEIEEHIEKEVARVIKELNEEDFSLDDSRVVREHIIINQSDLMDEETRERVDRQFRDAEKQLERARERLRAIQHREIINDELKIKLDLKREGLKGDHERIIRQAEKMQLQKEHEQEYFQELEKLHNKQLKESEKRVRDFIERPSRENQDPTMHRYAPNRDEIQNLENINEQLRGEMDELKEQMEKIQKQMNEMSEEGDS